MTSLTDRQKQEIDRLLTEKVEASQHQNWRYHIAKSEENYWRAKNKLRRMAYLPEYARPLKDGLYLNPTTHALYRVVRKGFDWQVSLYSESAKLRLVKNSHKVVKKGTWKKLNAFDSRRTYDKLRNSWYMTDEMKVQYQTGICNFCLRGLVDARSVWHNYGPTCADKFGLPWGDLPPESPEG